MEKNKKLNKKQMAFCRAYVFTRNKKEAAIAAGFKVFPEQAAEKLLQQSNIQKQIAQLEKNEKTVDAELVAGYRRLAFGSIADAVRLIEATETGEVLDVDTLDLFMVSELKKAKTGGIEIKFFDRLKALEKLSELRSFEKEGAEPFYKALEKSALVLRNDGEHPCS